MCEGGHVVLSLCPAEDGLRAARNPMYLSPWEPGRTGPAALTVLEPTDSPAAPPQLDEEDRRIPRSAFDIQALIAPASATKGVLWRSLLRNCGPNAMKVSNAERGERQVKQRNKPLAECMYAKLANSTFTTLNRFNSKMGSAGSIANFAHREWEGMWGA